MKKQIFTLELARKTLSAEISDLTEQAGGSVLLRLGETVVLVTAVMDETDDTERPYFPLSVEFEERFYAAGAILGGRFQRREGRPSEEAILSARMVDRTIRPLFPDHLRRGVQVVVTVLAMGEDDPDVLGIIGASLALGISPIPWDGPIGAVRIGKSPDTETLHINPTYTERTDRPLEYEILACGRDKTINMIEAGCYEVAEAKIVTALETAQTIHTKLVSWQEEVIVAAGKEKINIPAPEAAPELVKLYETQFADRLKNTLFSNQSGKRHIGMVVDEFIAAAHENTITSAVSPKRYAATKIDQLLHEEVLHTGIRPDGRACDEIRSLYAQAGGVSPVLHGSGIFYRGGTHIFSALTLGGPDDALHIDTIEAPESSKRFMHHYNFPPFSVGETGRVGGFNRRAIGHGALAEKAIVPVIPPKATFPYTIRLVSETMSSNGSSSMGSVCASTLALMDGGVPITRPVAGIASGLLLSNEKYRLLTDIQGPEDEYGDMDFKVAGTEEGVTAIQMDIKVDGIPIQILAEALEATRTARLTILAIMRQAIAAPRTELSDRAPYIESHQIAPEQIGLVIGSGGKTINSIKERSRVQEISIEDDGMIYITGNKTAVGTALEEIKAITKVYEVGETYTATITSITHFGAFAHFDSGKAEGLIHISEIAPHHIEKVEEVLSVGDTVPVCIIKNENGKIGLSIKANDPGLFCTTG